MFLTRFALKLALWITLILGGCLLLLTGCSSVQVTPVPTVSPEQLILFHNGVILTMNPAAPRATALAVRGETIQTVGADEEILALTGPTAIVVDLRGATLMPGFVDPHSHLFNDAKQYLDMNLLEAQQAALESGITTLGDLYVTEGFLREMRELDEAGGLQVRTSLYLVATDNCGRIQGDWWKEHPATDEPGEMLRVGGVKIFTDGGTCDKTPALSYELVSGEGMGDLFFSQEELDEMVAEVHSAGRQVAIHGIGDRAVDQAQNALAAALDGQPNTLRHRIEHNSVIRPEQLLRYGELGILPVIFGTYPICDPWGPPPPEAYRAWEWPWRALLDANPELPIAWKGDDPWVSQIGVLDDLYSMMTRNQVNGEGEICEGPEWQKQHTITAEEALPMMTINGAYTLFREDEVGSLEPGKYADLIILSDNPLTIPPQEIPEMAVWMTMVGGRVAYCAPGHDTICP